MAKENTVISEDFVKNAVIKWLSCNGWGYFKFDDLHTHGVDIRARAIKYSRYFYIETKGQGKLRQSSEVSGVMFIDKEDVLKQAKNCNYDSVVAFKEILKRAKAKGII